MSSRAITENDLRAILQSALSGVIESSKLIGEIKTYAGLTVPTGWLECDGHEELIEDYPLLAAALSADHPDPDEGAQGAGPQDRCGGAGELRTRFFDRKVWAAGG